MPSVYAAGFSLSPVKGRPGQGQGDEPCVMPFDSVPGHHVFNNLQPSTKSVWFHSSENNHGCELVAAGLCVLGGRLFPRRRALPVPGLEGATAYIAMPNLPSRRM
jgi:hypothetical protein